MNIFDYFDYRKYLRDYYDAKRESDPNFSYRYIQNKTGIDPGFLLKVFNKQKDLSFKYVPIFSALLKLNKRESKYFELLVSFGRAKKDADIKRNFEQLLECVEFSERKLAASQYEFYQKWHYTAVREAIGLFKFDGDYDQLARWVVPSITPAEAKGAIELLSRLGLVRKNRKGVYEVTSRFITTGSEWATLAVRSFQQEALHLAQNSIQRFPKEERDVSTLTVSISSEGFKKVRDALAKYRKEILKIAHDEVNVSRTYMINFAMFPITRQSLEDEN